MDNNLEQNSIHLIQQLEQRLQQLLIQHKELLEEKKEWEQKNHSLQEKIDQLTAENNRLSVYEMKEDWNDVLQSSKDKNQLKQYLDEVIKQIDANIKMLS